MRHIHRMNDPVTLALTNSFRETFAYFDVGIGKVDFSLSVFVKYTGIMQLQLFYGEELLGQVGPMSGIGGFAGTVTTAGDYDTSPGPYLTLRIYGAPVPGYYSTDVSCFLRPSSEDFVEPDSYDSPDFFDGNSPTVRSWMKIITTPWFRGDDGVPDDVPEKDCYNFATVEPTVGLDWAPFIGGGSTGNIPGVPSSGNVINPSGTAPTQAPPVIIPTPAPTFPDNPIVIADESVAPPELPAPIDGTLGSMYFAIGDISDPKIPLDSTQVLIQDYNVVGIESMLNANIVNEDSGWIFSFDQDDVTPPAAP